MCALLRRDQCWAKFVAPTGNFPASHEPNRNFKILAGHVPTKTMSTGTC